MLRLETGIGSIVLTNARLSPIGLLRLRAFNGDVRVTLAERPADARILALALNGHIRSDIPLTMKDTWGPRWGEATLGKGEPVMSSRRRDRHDRHSVAAIESRLPAGARRRAGRP